MVRIPKYRKHSSGQARVTIKGRDFLLGPHGSQESKAAYKAKIAELAAADSVESLIAKPEDVTMSELCNAYLEHSEKYYRQGSEHKQMKLAVYPVSELYDKHSVTEFGPTEFKTCRDWWLKREIPQGKDEEGNEKPPRRCCRSYINKQMSRVKRILRWGVEQELVKVSVLETLKCVAPLKQGRVDAPERKKISPVDAKLVMATLLNLPKVVADMVRFQCLTGCRPGEVCKITPEMVDRSNDVWEIILPEHKTSWRGKERAIYCNDTAKAILTPYLLRAPGAACFSPAEAMRQRLADRSANRKCKGGNRAGYSKKTRSAEVYERMPGTSYTTQSYGKAIQYACKRGKLDRWAPNQIRHSVATEINARVSLEAASVVLGHSGVDVTQVYAERDRQKAIEAVRKYRGFAIG